MIGGWWLPLLAVLAGTMSIASPCVLPLLPGYLAYVSTPGASPRDATESVAAPSPASGRMTGAILFCVGFTAVFVALGASASMLGQLLIEQRQVFVSIAGVVLIAAGLSFLGVLRLPAHFMGERRFAMHRVARGPSGAVVLGAAFAFGWTPCIGPVLASVLTMASSTASVVGGATLLGLYAVGLSVPLLAMALAAERVDPLVRTLRRHGQLIERLSGVLLVGVGLAYIAGWWQLLFVPLQRVLSRTGWPPL